MLPEVLTADSWIDQHLSPQQLSVYKRGPDKHHKDNLARLEPIFRMLQACPRVTGLMKALAKRTGISRSTLSTWKANLLSDPSWRPRRIHYASARRIFSDEQERELATRIATTYIAKGLFYTDADFKLDALRFYHES
jgi:hypothetical protein